MLVKKDLGSLAEQYALEVLNFDNALCKNLFHRVEGWLPKISCYSFLDRNLDIADFSMLGRGGLSGKAPDYLPLYLVNEYQSSRTTFALFDDVMLVPDEANLMDQVGTICVGNEVYHWCDLDRISTDNLRKLIWATSVSWHFVCVIFKFKDNIDDEILSRAIVNDLVGFEFLEIILGAYDGEGFVHYKF
ncbi:hypothetical protein [Thalassolituus sp. UBA3500]|uniref:hypothetical protein n=1 Tax=Thalassolituus sp. UBA3500 TaxID=1947664 RepID=UPI000C0E3354|nr:hypothetical protein [Thalassolituus sp. UBA3500]MBN59448.1 hypothetical protein [Oceanospirillaceae bacterium]|tara:strand:- start:24408 stop:24974 length:567 start_codon:yes stop_codon:yes gene_type:complete